MKGIERAKIDPVTGLPMRNDAGELVTERVNPKTGAPVAEKASPKKKAPAKKKAGGS